jgi:plastocyanin
MRSSFAFALIAAASLCAGCGDDVTAQQDAGMPDLSTADLSTFNADLAGVHIVTVSPSGALAFAPQMLTIKAGETVLWTWAAASHTVTSGAAAADGLFCSASSSSPSPSTCGAETGHGAGFIYIHTFPTAGTFPYFCNVHGAATMSGTITVQ